MSRLRRLLALPVAERRLLVRAVVVVGAVRLGLWVLPFGVLRRLLARASAGRGGGTTWSATQTAWAVAVASRHVPRGNTCLVQALAAAFLLVRSGHPARVRIGVSRNDGQRVQAHAWVESEGAVVSGEWGVEHYLPLPARDGGLL